MIIALIIIALIILSVIAFMQQPKFGKLPAGERLQKVKASLNYRDGQFQNIHHTPALAEGVNYFTAMKQFFLERDNRITPSDVIPSVKTDLHALTPEKDVLVWFGHSSYFIQADGRKILVDPVLSNFASPLPRGMKAFKTTATYSVDDIPAIDYLFITHDHWDHLSHETLLQLKPKIKRVFCPLGAGEHLEYWGFNKNIIIEKDWNEKIEPEDGFVVNTVPARHFSGRGFKRNQSLWISYALRTPNLNIFIGGDSGYDDHFLEAGKAFGPFDLAILENGQYHPSWKYIHMMPGEVLQAAKDLKAKRVLPVHSSRYTLSTHAWDEPLKQVTQLNEKVGVNLITPMIGEEVDLKDEAQRFTQWWKDVN